MKNVTLTEDQLAIINKHYKTMSRAALADRAGITERRLSAHMTLLGLRKKTVVVDMDSPKPGYFNEQEYKSTLLYA